MLSIWKYPFNLGFNYYDIPRGGSILSIQYQEQENRGCMWVLLSPQEPTERRVFQVIGTGQSVSNEGLSYVGTYQQDVFVWHVFEVHADA